MATDFVKKEDAEFVQQLKDHHTALGTHGAGLGFSLPEIADAGKDSAYMEYVVGQQSQAQGFSQGYTQFKRNMRLGTNTATEPVFVVPGVVPPAVPVGIEQRFRDRAAKAKSSTAYDNDIGEQLKIVAPISVFDPSTGKPTFKVFLDSGHPVLKWPKKNFQGVEVWADHGDGSGWVKQERDFKSPWVDKTDLPALGQSKVWKYKMIYVLNDETIGLWSDEVTVTVHGEV
jgi:hypothetical protein